MSKPIQTNDEVILIEELKTEGDYLWIKIKPPEDDLIILTESGLSSVRARDKDVYSHREKELVERIKKVLDKMDEIVEAKHGKFQNTNQVMGANVMKIIMRDALNDILSQSKQ